MKGRGSRKDAPTLLWYQMVSRRQTAVRGSGLAPSCFRLSSGVGAGSLWVKCEQQDPRGWEDGCFALAGLLCGLLPELLGKLFPEFSLLYLLSV